MRGWLLKRQILAISKAASSGFVAQFINTWCVSVFSSGKAVGENEKAA